MRIDKHSFYLQKRPQKWRKEKQNKNKRNKHRFSAFHFHFDVFLSSTVWNMQRSVFFCECFSCCCCPESCPIHVICLLHSNWYSKLKLELQSAYGLTNSSFIAPFAGEFLIYYCVVHQSIYSSLCLTFFLFVVLIFLFFSQVTSNSAFLPPFRINDVARGQLTLIKIAFRFFVLFHFVKLENKI